MPPLVPARTEDFKSIRMQHVATPGAPEASWGEVFFQADGCLAFIKPDGTVVDLCNAVGPIGKLGQVVIYDEFDADISGAVNYGRLRWGTTGTSYSRPAPAPGQVGLQRVQHAVINQWAGFVLTAAFHCDDTFDLNFILAFDDGHLTEGNYYIGFSNNSVGSAPGQGIFLRALKADSPRNWYAVTKDGVSESVIDTGVAFDASQHRFRARRVDGATIGFSIDGGAEVTRTANIPSLGGNLIMQGQCTTSGVGVEVQLTVDTVLGIINVSRP